MNLKRKIGSLALAVCLAISSTLPVFADSDQKIKVTLKDVTSMVNTRKGEAKVKVSVSGAVSGANEKATIAQLTLDYEGANYRSTQFLKGADDPENEQSWIAQQIGNNQIKTSILDMNGIDFSDNGDLFIITFEGKPGAKVTLTLTDLENTYCYVNGADRTADAVQSIELTASREGKEGTKAEINLVMDQLNSFAVMGNSQITLKITNEKTTDDIISTPIQLAMQSDGGHRSGKQMIPTFVVENMLIAEDTYTVEVSGIGYVTYKQSGVKLSDGLTITNSEFVPGDVDGDGDVDSDDKAMVEKLIADDDYSIAADFNRDGEVGDSDLAVFDGIEDETDDNTDDSGSTDGDGDGDSDEGSGGGTGGSSGGSGGSSGSGGGGIGGGFGGTATTTPSNSETFTDLTNYAWAKESIYTLKNKGVISGISDTEFAPANNIKRGDFILILTRMLGLNDAFTENFADVPESAYYYNAVGAAKAAGIASGDGDNFLPEASITRQDLITLAYRAFLNQGYITETDDLSVLDVFSDKDDISEYAKSAMASMVKAGIIQGSDGTVNPKGNATRAEVAVMCARMLGLMK